jgi:cytochrome c oxidase accessory protein FixG
MSTLTNEQFRDSLATVDDRGDRVWIYPKKPKGKLHNYRILVTIFLLGILLSGPFIKINGNPFLLLNIFDRKFVIFGQIFWPQDTHLLIFVLLIFVVFILVFTVAFGRIWCGWACPQTIFMEMVFRKIEYWIEGDANQQKKLNSASWTAEKVLKKGVKQLIFIAISLIISHTVMAYLIGIEETIDIISHSPANNMAGFIGLMAFTGIFYFVFSYFREQACIVVCPYGRLQGVLLDKNSIVVAYDWLRGEPRGKKSKKKEENIAKGDCIDCTLCVQVCPTGIDIRNGTQLECVNCTACIDACDDVMLKVNRPTGLIRFDSFNGIEKKEQLKFNPRIAAYTGILVILISAFFYLIFSREILEATITRVPGTLYTLTESGTVSNLYQVQVINKSNEELPVILNLKDVEGVVKLIGGGDLNLAVQEKQERTFFVEIPKGKLKGGKNQIVIEVISGERIIDEIKTSFLAPGKR